MHKNIIFEKLAMSITFCVFVYSLISPAYIVVAGTSLPDIIYGRIPGMAMRFTFFEYIAVSVFFALLILFFVSHALYEKDIYTKIVCIFSLIYCMAYLAIILLVGINGLVIFNFPIISIPLWLVLVSKFFILFPAAYFFIVALRPSNSAYVRWSAMIHAASLVVMGIIKVFEIIFPANLRMLFFDISTTVYLISLAMVTFFMYRKSYDTYKE